MLFTDSVKSILILENYLIISFFTPRDTAGELIDINTLSERALAPAIVITDL